MLICGHDASTEEILYCSAEKEQEYSSRRKKIFARPQSYHTSLPYSYFFPPCPQNYYGMFAKCRGHPMLTHHPHSSTCLTISTLSARLDVTVTRCYNPADVLPALHNVTTAVNGEDTPTANLQTLQIRSAKLMISPSLNLLVYAFYSSLERKAAKVLTI